jgi:YD repeat-containing protein
MRQQGRILYTRMVSGGVDMNVMLHHKFESIGEASRLRRLAAESRPAAAPQWDFADGASRLRATAVPMAAGTIFRPVEPDHQFDHDLGTPPDFALRRIYLGAGSTHGLCGPGWDIFVPYSLSISVPLGKRPETLDPKISAASSQAQGVIFLKEAETGAAYVYRKITHKSATGDPCWALVRPILMGNENRSLEYHPTDCIYWRDNHYVVRRGREYHFDGSGRLMEVFSGKTLVARYKWNVDRLDSIEDGLGRRYSLSFNPADQRFDGVVISDGQTIDYRYGPDGSLLEVKVNDRVNSQYGYDTIGRLTETIGSDGRVTARATYNAAGLLSNHTGSDDVRTEDGDVIKRYLDNGRIDLVRDQHGAKASFLYFGTGHLTSITVTSSAKETWRFEYGANRTLKRVIDPFGRIAETRINCHGHSSCRSDRVG